MCKKKEKVQIRSFHGLIVALKILAQTSEPFTVCLPEEPTFIGFDYRGRRVWRGIVISPPEITVFNEYEECYVVVFQPFRHQKGGGRRVTLSDTSEMMIMVEDIKSIY